MGRVLAHADVGAAMVSAAAADPVAAMCDCIRVSESMGRRSTKSSASLDLIAQDLEATLPSREGPLAHSAAARPAAAGGAPSTRVKWVVLTFLVFQNSAASLLMQRSRRGAEEWNSQTAVIAQEAIKAVVCMGLVIRSDGVRSLREAFMPGREALRTAVPAILYLFQNNMQYVAISYLDASTYSVLYQFKILTTAILSVAILGRRLSLAQWLALCVLTAGASAVVVSELASSTSMHHSGKADVLPGVAAVLMACCSSGLAGVYFEKLVKGSSLSLWARNLQLALYSLAIGFASLHQVGAPLAGRDFFKGYTPAVWLAIVNNALGGLLIAVVIKYADTILKNFSTTLSILLTTCLSVVWFGSPVTAMSSLGTALVIYAVFLYGGMGGMAACSALVDTRWDCARPMDIPSLFAWCVRPSRSKEEAAPVEAGLQTALSRRFGEQGGA